MAPRFIPDFGDTVTGTVADENDWTQAGPRIIQPRRTATGTVTGLFPDAPAAAKIQTGTGETVCVRETFPASPRNR